MGDIKNRMSPVVEGASDIEAALPRFVSFVQDRLTAMYRKEYPTQTPPVLSIDKGKRYARIVRTGNGDSRDVYGFVDMTNGDLLKAAGWKGPAKGVRGSVLDSTTWDAAGPYSLGGSLKWT
jgi:hypothetical protein